MAEYVDKRALKIEMFKYLLSVSIPSQIKNAIYSRINSFPASDVRQVIHCKDCANTREHGTEEEPCIYCTVWDWEEMPPTGFCHKGRKKHD